MTDSELLKAAALACEYEWSQRADKMRAEIGVISLWVYAKSSVWNPLACSGQALDLVAKLGLSMCFTSDSVIVGRTLAPARCASVYLDGDAEAATRRAIVLAAAEIGREVQP